MTIEAVALLVLGLLAIAGAIQHQFSIVPVVCAVPAVALMARRPWIDRHGILHSRAYIFPVFKRTPLAEVVIFEFVNVRSMEWSPRGCCGVRARLRDGSTVQVQESTSMGRRGPDEWLASLNAVLERERGTAPAPWVEQPRKAALLDRSVIGREPYESIRTVRQAAVGDFVVRAASVADGFAAVTTRVGDGSNVSIGLSRPTIDLAIEDAIGEIDRLLRGA